MINEELIEPIYEDTKTINLLNRFEEYELEANPIYQRIVVKNTKFWDGEYHVGYNLVIERADPMCKCVGDCTFTQLKADESYELRDYIHSQMDDDTIMRYKDKDRFYRFFQPFKLRGQNRFNRRGYGWNGSQYGDTTTYFCVGVYISSDYLYNPDKRLPFAKPRNWATEV